MRVLFLTTSLRGGAGIACRRIWEAFREQNDVSLATLAYRDKADLRIDQYSRETKETISQVIYKHDSEWADEQLSVLFREERSAFSGTYLSAMQLAGPYDEFLIDLFDMHDVVNMHWISGLLSFKALNYLKSSEKPVLVTLHDHKHLTGACHYSACCRKFSDSCSQCPQLATIDSQLLAENQHSMKRSILSSPNFFWTGPSEWIVKEARASRIPYSKKNILGSIKNPVVDDAACTPDEIDNITARFDSPRKKVALIADDLSDGRKGILLGVKALAMAVANSAVLRTGIDLHLVGSTEGSENTIRDIISEMLTPHTNGEPINIISYGRLPSHHLGLILKLCDLLVFPSIEENYANLLIESLGQGTVAAGFAVGGNREIAANYPDLMKTVGAKLNIVNGINTSDERRINHVVLLLSKAIQEHLEDTQPKPHFADAISRCKVNHSRTKIARDYYQSMLSMLDEMHSHDLLSTRTLSANSNTNLSLATSKTLVHRLRKANSSEPVYWLGTGNDWPVNTSQDDVLFIVTLRPSWSEDYYVTRLNRDNYTWLEFKLFNHDSYQIPELQYWDLVLLTATKRGSSNLSFSQLLLSTSEPINSMPVLMAAVLDVSYTIPDLLTNLADLMWVFISGKPLILPMNGLSCYPRSSPFLHSVDMEVVLKSIQKTRVRNLLSRIIPSQVNTEEPVYWLGRDAFVDILYSQSFFLLCIALYPSWDCDYLNSIFSAEIEFEVLHEVPATQAQLPQLEHWNTVVIALKTIQSCFLFSESVDPIHCLPVLTMTLSNEKTILSADQFSLLSTTNSGNKVVIPVMAGFHAITSVIS